LRICPGEDECERFQSAAGLDRATKAANACTGCALLPTKLSGAGDEWQLAAIERVRRERDSGAALDLSAISPAIWELVQWWDQAAARAERHLRNETRELLAALMTTSR
jgi:hypothetical protein